MENKRDVIALITKLNDRNIQRRRESGITTYALLAVLSVLVIEIVDLGPKILNHGNHFQIAKVMLGTATLFFNVLLVITTFYLTVGYPSPVRLIKRTVNHGSILETCNTLFFLACPLALSLYYLLIQKGWFGWYLFIYFSLFFVLAILIAIDRTKQNKDFIRVSQTGIPYKEKNIVIIIFYIIGTVTISLVIFFFLHDKINLDNETVTNSIKLTLYVLSIPLILSYVSTLKNLDLKNRFLEELEVEIYINKLSDEQIIEEIRNNYVGIGVQNWIDIQTDLFNSFIAEISSELEKIENYAAEIMQLDRKTYPHEYAGRCKAIENNLALVVNVSKKEVDRLSVAINNIFNETYSHIDSQDLINLRRFIFETSPKFSSIDKQVSAIRKKL